MNGLVVNLKDKSGVLTRLVKEVLGVREQMREIEKKLLESAVSADDKHYLK